MGADGSGGRMQVEVKEKEGREE